MCGDHHVQKIISGGHFLKSSAKPVVQPSPRHPVPEPSVNTGVAASGALDSITVLKAVKHYVSTHFENVGDDFAQQAKDMHDGTAPYKNIYGQANPEEQKKLVEADVPHFIIPELPPEYNN